MRLVLSAFSSTRIVAVATLSGVGLFTVYKFYQSLRMGNLWSKVIGCVHCPHKDEDSESLTQVPCKNNATTVCHQQQIIIPSVSGSQTPSDPSPKTTPLSSPILSEQINQDVPFKSQEFVWEGEANCVQVAGSFLDDWKGRLNLHKCETGWIGATSMPPGEHQFKFIVDGQWISSAKYNTCKDISHNTNNTIRI